MSRQEHSAYPKASETDLVLPRVSKWHRNINLFPFPLKEVNSKVRIGLLTADKHCCETLAPSAVGILTPLMLLLLPGSSFLRGPLDFTAELLPSQNAPLRDHLAVPLGLGSRFSPVHFRGP